MQTNDDAWNDFFLHLLVRPYGALATIGGSILTGFGFILLGKAIGLQQMASDGATPRPFSVQASVAPGHLTLRW